MDIGQIAVTAWQAGFRGLSLVNAVAVAMAESGGKPDAHNTNGEDSRGLWQINVGPGAHPDLAGLDLYDPLTNAKAAFSISKGGTDFSAWTTFVNGAYQQFTAAAQAVAGLLDPAIFQLPPKADPKLPPLPGIDLPGIFKLPPKAQIADPFQAIASAISDLTTTIGNLPHSTLGPFVDFFNQIHNFSVWLGQPNLWLRVLMILVGILLLVLGLILFAASFVPKGARLPLPVP